MILCLRGRRASAVLWLLALASLYFLSSTTHSVNTIPCYLTRAHARREGQDQRQANVPRPSLNSPHFVNLNHLDTSAQAETRQEKLLVLSVQTELDIPLDLATLLSRLDATTYPNQLISVAVLVPSSADKAALLQVLAPPRPTHWLKHQSPPRPMFANVAVYVRDYPITAADPNEREMVLSRARNFLLATALREHHHWVAWVDSHVQFPSTVFQDLMRHNADIVVPNCLLLRDDPGDFWGHDRHNWQESDDSMHAQLSVGKDYLFPAGLEYLNRSLLVDMPTHLGLDYKVPLDAVGTTFTLVKANVHRQGINFPAFPYRHHTGSEAFGKIANAMGFRVYGVPGYRVHYVPPSLSS